MAGAYFNPVTVMRMRDVSLSRTPFNPSIMVIKGASFPKGTTPGHLVRFRFPSGHCAGMGGTGIYKGKYLPKTAICTAAKYDLVSMPSPAAPAPKVTGRKPPWG